MSTVTAPAPPARVRLARIATAGRERRRYVLDAAVLLVVVVALVFVLPARAVVAGLGAAGRPHFVVAVALLVWWLVSLLHPRLRASGSHTLTTLVFVYVGWLAVTWAAGYDRGLTAAESSGTDRSMIAAFAYLGIMVVAAAGLTTRRRVDLVLRTVVAGAAFSAVFGWVQFFFRRDYTSYLMPPGLVANQPLVGISARGTEQFARVAGTAGHYIEFGVVCAMTLPLAIHYVMQRPKGKRGWAWTAVVLIGGAVPFSLSRSAIVAFALVAIVMLIGWPARWRLNAICTLLLSIPVYMVLKPGLLGTIKSLFLNAATDPSITGRTSDYATVWRYVAQRPFVGRGTGTFIPQQYILLDNQWLLSLLEIGWIGVVLLAVLFLSTIRVLLTIRRRARFLGDAGMANLALSLIAIVATFAVTAGFFDAFFFTTATTLLWLAIGVTVALARQQRRQFERLGLRPLRMGERLRALGGLARGMDPEVAYDVERARWI